MLDRRVDGRCGQHTKPNPLAMTRRAHTGALAAAHRGRRRYLPSARPVSGECVTIGVRGTCSHNNAEGIGE